MTAKSQAQRSKESRDKAAAEAERLGIVKRKWPVPAGIDTMLVALCKQHGFTDWRELIETAIQRLHDNPEQAAAFLAVTRHEITITPKVARQLQAQGARQARQLDHAEQ